MTAPDYIGTLPGQFAIDSNGGAQYSVPLTLPPGTAGMMPSLSLAYNSGGGNGILGVGWSLQGLSSITRTPATMAQDLFIGAVGYNETDRFSLDGQRLVPVSGTSYQDPASVYQTELESWRKVVPVFGPNQPAGRSGPDSFIVYTKNGRRLEYGTTPDAQVAASDTNPSIRTWALNKITDLNGNYLTISYLRDPASGAFYPQTIQYTGNALASLAPQRAVQFYYQSRTDVWTSYIGGAPVTTDQLLQSIQTFVDGQLVMSYTLAYDTGQATGRSRLRSITQADAQGAALTPSTFEWQDGEAKFFDVGQALSPTNASWQGRLIPLDVNGDGRTDLVNLYEVNNRLAMTIFLSDGSDLRQAGQLQTTIPYYNEAQIIPLDIDGNGCMDLIYASGTSGSLGLTLLQATPDGQGGWTYQAGTFNGAGPTGVPYGQLTAMDVDGDGLVDLVCSYDDEGRLRLKLLFSTGNSFALSSQDQTTPTLTYSEGAQILPIQFRGSALTDLLYVYAQANTFSVNLFLSQGRQGLVQQATSPVPAGVSLSASGVLTVLDINGDGIGDLVHVSLQSQTLEVQTLISTGVQFVAGDAQSFQVGSLGTDPPMLLPMDVNGDGLPDLVLATQNEQQISLQLLLSTGSGFALRSNVTQPGNAIPGVANPLAADINGNGKGDLVFAFQSAGQLALGTAPAAGAFPDLLTTTTNGLGGAISLSYKPLTDPSVYSRGAPAQQQIEAAALIGNRTTGASYPLSGSGGAQTPGVTYATRTVDFPKYVVAGYSKNDGNGNSYTYSHFYMGAKIDLSGRGWLGFATVQSSDLQNQTGTLTTYNQTFPQTGTVQASLTTRLTDGAWMHLVTMDYTTPSPSNGVYQCLPASVVSRFYTFAPAPGQGDSAAAPDDTHTLGYIYDEFGNETLRTEVGTSTVYTHQSFANDPVNWLIGYKTEHKVTADRAGTDLLSWHRMTFLPDTQNLRTHEVWDDQQQIWLVTTRSYDTCGNVTSVADPTGAATTILYEPTYRSFLSQVSSPADGGAALVTTYQIDPRFGTMQSRTDVNQLTFRQQVDGLGRVVEQLGPDPDNPASAVSISQTSWASGPDGIYVETRRVLDWTSPSWSWSRAYVDGFGRSIRAAALGPDGASTAIVDMRYDSRDRVVAQTLPYYEGETPVWTQRTYDDYGRLVRLTQPTADTTSSTTIDYTTYDRAVQTEAVGTPDARQTVFEYGTFASKRLLTSRTDASGATTTYVYDAVGRIIQTVDPLSVVTTTSYDTLDRTVALAVRSGGSVLHSEQFQYQDNQRQFVHMTGGGTQVRLSYDAQRRIIAKQAGMRKVTFVYDAPGTANGLGRLCTVTDPDGANYEYAYDPYGNQSTISVTIGASTYTFKRTYTPTQKLAQLTYPDGSTLTNGYNAAGFLATVACGESSEAEQTVATYGGYTASGQPQTLAYRNGVTESLAFSQAGQLARHTIAGPFGASEDLTLTWNAFGTIQATADAVAPARNQTFGFDPTGRLQTATGAFSANYAYDAGGSITSKEGVTYVPNGYQVATGTENGQQVFSAEYDADGNTTSMTAGGATYAMTYDEEGQLVQANACTFSYDHTGRRLTKSVPNGPTTVYVAPYYDVTTFPDGSAQHTKYVLGAGSRVASITTADKGAGNPAGNPYAGIPLPGMYILHKDHLGSTTALTDSAGRVATSIAYRAFGSIDTIRGPDIVRYKFTGKELDAETGLYYIRSRYYSPVTGRFISADSQIGGPIFTRDAFNRYAYALNDPVNYVDPTGHSVFSHIGHFVSHDDANFFSHDVKGFFTNEVKSGFTKNIAETITSFVVDAALVVGGVVVLATTPFGGAAASGILGSMLLGAGISGLTYNITTLASHKAFSWAAYGEQLAIGSAAGLISGGIAAGAGAVVGAMATRAVASALEITEESQLLGAQMMNQAARWAVGGGLRILANTVAATFGNAGSGAASTLLNNWAGHTSLTSGLGWSILMGGLMGAAGGALSEGIAAGLSQRFNSLSALAEQNIAKYSDCWGAANDGWNTNALFAKEGLAIMEESKWNNFWLGMPGVTFSGLDAMLTSVGFHPRW